MAGALATHAEAVFEGLSPADMAVARRLLLRLVAIDGASWPIVSLINRRLMPRPRSCFAR